MKKRISENTIYNNYPNRCELETIKINYFNPINRSKINKPAKKCIEDEDLKKLYIHNSFLINTIKNYKKLKDKLENEIFNQNELSTNIYEYKKLIDLDCNEKFKKEEESRKKSIWNFENLNFEIKNYKKDYDKVFKDLFNLKFKTETLEQNKFKNKDIYKKNIFELEDLNKEIEKYKEIKSEKNIFKINKTEEILEIKKLIIINLIFSQLNSDNLSRNFFFLSRKLNDNTNIFDYIYKCDIANNYLYINEIILKFKIKFNSMYIEGDKENIHYYNNQNYIDLYFIENELYFLSCFFSDYKFILEYQLNDPYYYLGSLYNVTSINEKNIDYTFKDLIKYKILNNNKKNRKPIIMISGYFGFEDLKSIIKNTLKVNFLFLNKIEFESKIKITYTRNNINEEYIYDDNQPIDEFLQIIYSNLNLGIGLLKIIILINNIETEFIQNFILIYFNENNYIYYQKLINGYYDSIFGDRLNLKKKPKNLIFFNHFINKEEIELYRNSTEIRFLKNLI